MARVKDIRPLPRALIGHTGFVGGNILRQSRFDCLYNSKNIKMMQEVAQFEIVVCAAPASVKWRANKCPEEDFASIKLLMDVLETIETQKFILISTIDVYPVARMVDEDSPIGLEGLVPYSRHRRHLELFVEKMFNALVVRLPGLFGSGLRKNIIYDLLHNDQKFVHQDGVVQYYNLENIWCDLNIALKNHLKVLNIAPEPIAVKEIAKVAFGIELDNDLPPPPPLYDMHTKHALFWNREGVYLYDKGAILDELRNFVARWRIARENT